MFLGRGDLTESKRKGYWSTEIINGDSENSLVQVDYKKIELGVSPGPLYEKFDQLILALTFAMRFGPSSAGSTVSFFPPTSIVTIPDAHPPLY